MGPAYTVLAVGGAVGWEGWLDDWWGVRAVVFGSDRPTQSAQPCLNATCGTERGALLSTSLVVWGSTPWASACQWLLLPCWEVPADSLESCVANAGARDFCTLLFGSLLVPCT